MYLVLLMEKDWEEKNKVNAFLNSCDSKNVNEGETEPSLLHILASIIHKANIRDTSEFMSSIQLDIKKSKTYKRAIYRSHK